MPQRPRDFDRGIHHVWVNATGNWPYFLDEEDRSTWIRRLVRTVDRNSWTCIAFCLMTTHIHLLTFVPDESLPVGMQYLNREYSRDFNARHDRVGIFVRRRYGNRRIEDGADLLGTYSYVVLNATKEGMCRAPEDWAWCSYATTIGLCDDFAFVDASLVLAELARPTIEALREFVNAQHRLMQSISDPAGI